MAAPLVGITTYHRDQLGDGDARMRFWLPTAYVDAVRGAGGIPVLLSPGETRVDDVLARLDGILFAGGGDLHPDCYDGSAHATSYSVSEERDEFESALLNGALRDGQAILAICRGLQLLNVVRGGDLHGHLPDLGIDEKAHRTSQLEHAYHDVSLESDSLLGRIFSTPKLAIASWHHQAVNQLGKGLRVVARAPDGTVEGLELEGHGNLLAVQWHPELQIEAGSPQWHLFESFVALARESHTP